MLISIPHQMNWRPRTRWVLVAATAICLTQLIFASPLNLGEMFRSKLNAIDHALRLGEWETYSTGYAWHLPYGYQESTRARLNETTWGGGFGRTISDDDGDRHSVFLMAFADSHRAPQFNLGYAWQRYWKMSRNVNVGAGYLAFFFSREDVANHVPMPALLPCASVTYRGIEVIGLFVPRISRDIKGDVLFIYLRMPLGRSREVRERRPGISADRERRRSSRSR